MQPCKARSYIGEGLTKPAVPITGCQCLFNERGDLDKIAIITHLKTRVRRVLSKIGETHAARPKGFSKAKSSHDH